MQVSTLCDIVVDRIASSIEYWCHGLTQEYLKGSKLFSLMCDRKNFTADCLYLLTPFDNYFLPSHLRQKLIGTAPCNVQRAS